jgi:hypothetical protein
MIDTFRPGISRNKSARFSRFAAGRNPGRSGMMAGWKIAAGYVLHPSHENDSCYFILRL